MSLDDVEAVARGRVWDGTVRIMCDNPWNDLKYRIEVSDWERQRFDQYTACVPIRLDGAAKRTCGSDRYPRGCGG